MSTITLKKETQAFTAGKEFLMDALHMYRKLSALSAIQSEDDWRGIFNTVTNLQGRVFEELCNDADVQAFFNCTPDRIGIHRDLVKARFLKNPEKQYVVTCSIGAEFSSNVTTSESLEYLVMPGKMPETQVNKLKKRLQAKLNTELEKRKIKNPDVAVQFQRYTAKHSGGSVLLNAELIVMSKQELFAQLDSIREAMQIESAAECVKTAIAGLKSTAQDKLKSFQKRSKVTL